MLTITEPVLIDLDLVPLVLARVSSSWMMPQPALVGFRECFHLSVAPALFQFHSLYNMLRRLIDLQKDPTDHNAGRERSGGGGAIKNNPPSTPFVLFYAPTCRRRYCMEYKGVRRVVARDNPKPLLSPLWPKGFETRRPSQYQHPLTTYHRISLCDSHTQRKSCTRSLRSYGQRSRSTITPA